MRAPVLTMIFAAALAASSCRTKYQGDPPEEQPHHSCTANSAPSFSAALLDPAQVRVASQPGGLGGGGQFVVGRSYVTLTPESVADGARVELHAPVDMDLIFFTQYVDPGRPNAPAQWALTFEVSCEVELRFAHMNDVAMKISDENAGAPPSLSGHAVEPPVHFTAGEVFAYKVHAPEYGADSFDFELKNNSVRNTFVNQQRYEAGTGTDLVHLDCPWKYFAEPLRSQYFGVLGVVDDSGSVVNLRATSCRAVSADHAGTLAGTWFTNADPVFEINPSGDLREGNYGAYAHFVDEFGLYVTIGNLGPVITTYKIFASTEPTYLSPEAVTGRHCYSLGVPNVRTGYVDANITSPTTLRLVYAETGVCPPAFEDAAAKSYYR